MAIRVLVVDDSSFFRRRVSEILTADGDIEVVATAANGAEGVAQAKAVRPDVITMDIEMPVLDGISAVRQIMDQSPTPILMFSSLTHAGAQATLDALEAGALDFLPKKFEDIARSREDATNILQQRVKALAHKPVARIAASRLQTVSSTQASTPSGRFTTESRLENLSRPSAGNSVRSSAGRFTDPSTSSLTGNSAGNATGSLTGNLGDSSAARFTGKSAGSATGGSAPSAPNGSARTPLSRSPNVPGTPLKPPSSSPSHARSSLTRPSPRDTLERSSIREYTSAGQRSGQSPLGSAGLNANSRYKLLAIGTSTGGPVALQTILTQFPANFPYPIVLVQHMPATFTKAFAQRLDGLCEISVKEAQDGDVLQPGVAYLAPGGTQMLADGRSGHARLRIRSDDDARITYRPSVDLTFASLSKVYGGQVLGIILTGMGADGREGCRMLRAAGATIWAQDKDSCVVYGMPQAVAAAGISSSDIPLPQIARQIMTEVGYATS